MAYKDHFKIADEMIEHLNLTISEISDPFIASRYIGFVSVASVTVYELAIKEIFTEFAEKKNKVFGTFTRSHFDRISGRIRHQTIKEDYIKRFGDRYVKRYKRKIDEVEKKGLREDGVSILNSYNNIIVWRNEFAHAGIIPSTVTFQEVVTSYEAGKKLIECIAETMKR